MHQNAFVHRNAGVHQNFPICIVPINEAEAILEPFWDGGSSEHPTDKLSLLGAYTLRVPEGVVGAVEQTWCAIRVSFEHAHPGATITMQRDCDLDVSGYDVFRVFASIPSWVCLEVTGLVDGTQQTIIAPIAGTDTNDEFDGPLRGSRLTGYTLAYTLTEDRPASIDVLWTGLSNQAKQREMEARTSPYTSDWPGMLVAEVAPERVEPQIGILFGPQELASLRHKLHEPALAEAYAALKESLADAMGWEPEAEIGRYIAKPDRRWVRNRDMDKHCTAGVMEALAFVGLIEQNLEMLRMAARMALSAAHCETWSESIVGTLPGTTWHHRSFTEEIYSRACGLVLDWAGCVLTPHARQLIADAIIMKGLPRIESDFKRMEYIRHMNQGIVFSSGRILGVLALLPLYPRYATLIDEAERDFHEMIGNYVHDDGGTLEGMGYWSYTFASVMPIVWALARYRGQTMAAYATPALRKTGEYGLGMLATAGDGTSYLAVNDAHQDGHYPPGLCAAYASLSGDPRWLALYEAGLRAEKRAVDIYQLIMAPDAATWRAVAKQPGSTGGLRATGSPLLAPRFTTFPNVGQVSTVRAWDGGATALEQDAGALVHFHLCSGPTYGGHFHQDKGAFILEAGGEALAFDRGVTSYHHPETHLIGMASRHNLLYPESPDGRFIQQPADAFGATLTDARQVDGVFMAASDNRAAWEQGIFARNIRRVFSPAPNLYLIDDDVTLEEAAWIGSAQALRLGFRVNTPFEARTTDAGAVVDASRYALHILPLNWRPVEATAGVEGIDSHLHPTNLIRLVAEPRLALRLLTLLLVLPLGVSAPEGIGSAEQPPVAAMDANRVDVRLGAIRMQIDASVEDSLLVTVFHGFAAADTPLDQGAHEDAGDSASLTHRCVGGVWQ